MLMSIFLSKVFPLIFIYPLGVTCLLLVLALILMWRKSRWAPAPVGMALATIWLTSNVWTTNWMLQSLEYQHVPRGDLPKAEAIVMLGGATRSQSYPRPSVDLREQGDRVLYTAQLYKQGKAPVVIISGGRIDWMESGTAEATDVAKLLVADFGVPAGAIVEEPSSMNTYENAVNVQKILQQRGIKQFLLVTSALHMPRSMRIFQKLGMNPIAAPTDYLAAKSDLEEPNKTVEAFILGLLPSSDKLEKFSVAFKERFGTWTYILKGWA
jgi:uncharacterized SAM-binding protein YcdF (DUF218 family)